MQSYPDDRASELQGGIWLRVLPGYAAKQEAFCVVKHRSLTITFICAECEIRKRKV